jgi:hypothetical protein
MYETMRVTRLSPQNASFFSLSPFLALMFQVVVFRSCASAIT